MRFNFNLCLIYPTIIFFFRNLYFRKKKLLLRSFFRQDYKIFIALGNFKKIFFSVLN